MKVAIIGSGTMGSGIAQVAATADCDVLVYDTNQKALAASDLKLKKILDRLVEKGKISQTQNETVINKIQYISDLGLIKDSNIVIEAIIENADIKKQVFRNIESLVSKECILASNTSSLSITSLAANCKNPERFIGIHFFNPAGLMKLVEIIPAIQTDKNVVDKAIALIQSWGKITVCAKDTPGFIVNKVARPFYSEALRIFEEGIQDLNPETAFATIDWAMTEYGGFKMGPFKLMDFIGNDINYTVTESVFQAFYYDPRYKPSFTQKRLSEAGYLGRKSGRGFYNYENGEPNALPLKDEILGKQIADRIVVMLINEAADTHFMNIASIKDIELAMTKGVNYPKGLLQWADEIGIQECVNKMDNLYDIYHEDRYRCCALLRKMAEQRKTFY
jgi:3-hydroxybutyryl-CoA dehydrogenase